ncbi:MAG: hypothetical protein WC205_16880 [Opitutaceae bacterium]|jgi:hypothetical protein
MNATARELFRQNLIAQLAAAGAVGLKPAMLKVGAKVGGFEPADKELDDALDYLADKKLVMVIDKTISPENKRWKITSAGYDYAAQEGLV